MGLTRGGQSVMRVLRGLRPAGARRDAAIDLRGTMRARLLVCAAILATGTAGVGTRLVYPRVIDHADLTARADRQQMRTVVPPAKRGEIFDRKGRLLAYSVDADTIAAVPTDIDDPADVAAQVCHALDNCNSDRRQAIAKSLGRRAPLAFVAPQVPPDEGRRIKGLGLQGL